MQMLAKYHITEGFIYQEQYSVGDVLASILDN